MKVLDANFLIDYLNGEPATKEFYEANGGDDERWSTPAPAYAETIVGIGNLPAGDVDRAIDALAWIDVYEVDRELSIEAARIADEIGPQGPFLDGVDALVAALGRTRDATVVSSDSDLTHPETTAVVDVTDY
ncbi:PIN domain-containing protein [Natronolimnohabitans innermongolicus]|uniref:Ribonuclease VapC n=1 Tax=Natronolimnohabitans innermongolicus JCM 12255 TaxID=1227499 RepID=L9WHM7_9EURY|nr:PIN domain-containing protein [Natronolimnohabitans innermongolicus]ELY48862.1 PilT domain-containing protein [Natronolimnohabitans innermongolicus JCM 12255]